MADKILRITFNGVSTLTPGPPQEGEDAPQKAYVLMAANRQRRRNEWEADIDPHSPFVYVPALALGGDVPLPAEAVVDDKLGPCNIYFFDHARVVFDPPPKPGITYFTDPTRPLKERPGSDDVAPEHDIRWLMDVRQVLPDAKLKAAADPSATALGPEVAAVVELGGGVLKANFPCKTAQPKTFRDRKGGRVEGFKRVLAAEFFIEMRFDENTPAVALRLEPLRGPDGERPAGIAGDVLILRWGDRTTIDLRIGNDTRPETRALVSFKRCDVRTRDVNGQPVAVPRDDDFDMHYDLLDIPGGIRPLPQNGPHQTQFDHCSPAAVRRTTGG